MSFSTYRVGDHVYVEDSPSGPYDIRRIEELTRTPSGRVDAKLSCFFRRTDVSASLIQFADENLGALVEDESLTSRQRQLLAERELFNSNVLEIVSVSLIRGKCSVLKVSAVESAFSYLGKDDLFFYCFMYEPSGRTLMCDEGEIRVGSEYQSGVPSMLNKQETDPRNFESLETLMWTPEHGLVDDDIMRYLDEVKSIGTFARTLDTSSRIQQNSLLMSAVSASRDITSFLALDVLHKHHYDLSKALSSLVPSPSVVIPRDELEDWSVSEANLFEEALEKIGKDFFAIRQDVLPWKSMKGIVEYYYMWKTTDRYSKQKTVKANEAKSRLGKINLPDANNEQARNGSAVSSSKKPCGNCGSASSALWFSVQTLGTGKVCQGCWEYWKKYAGLRVIDQRSS